MLCYHVSKHWTWVSKHKFFQEKAVNATSYCKLKCLVWFLDTDPYFSFLNILLLSFSFICCISMYYKFASENLPWFLLALDSFNKFSSLSCAVAKVIQCLQEYGNSNILSEHTRQHLHSTFWSHSGSKFPPSAACFLIAGVLWNSTLSILPSMIWLLVIICLCMPHAWLNAVWYMFCICLRDYSICHILYLLSCCCLVWYVTLRISCKMFPW